MKRITITLFSILFLTLLSACGKSNELSDGTFLKYTISPAGEGQVFEFFDRNIEVASDGTVKLYCDDFEEAYCEEYPTAVIQLSDKEIDRLKALIIKNRSLWLQEDTSTDSCDGSYSYLTVYTRKGSHKTGGLNVDNKKFAAIEELLYDMAGEDFGNLISEVYVMQEQGYQKK